MKPSANAAAAAPSRAPVYLSALLMPGAGQFAQRRWLPALLFSITFLVCFGAMAWEILRGTFTFAMSIMDPAQPYATLSWKRILLALGLGLIVYVIGLCDTYLAYLRESRAWGERQMEEKLKKLAALGGCRTFPPRADPPAAEAAPNPPPS